jgi:hypothetical protein
VGGAKALSLIRKAIERSDEHIAESRLLGEVLSGRATVFSGDQSVMICTLHEHECGKREGHVWLAAGSLDEIRGPLREQAEMWAKMNGATTATVDGRAGWKRALKSIGFDGDEGLEKVL